MKRNKVLLGLYVGLLTLAGGVANAQTSSSFHEIGPSNVGGHISCLVADCQDSSRTTLYAGAATGGLFVRSSNEGILRTLYTNLGVDENLADIYVADTDSWHRVPYNVNGREISLPISTMLQGPAEEPVLYIGTGNDDHTLATTYTKMSSKGTGVYRYDPSANTNPFTVIPTTANDDFVSVNDMEYIYRNGKMYLFVATSTGLFRWVHTVGSNDWSQSPTRVFTGKVDEIVIERSRKVAFFSSGNQLYRIGDVTVGSISSANVINISTSNPAFGGTNTDIKLAVSQNTDTMYLYAMVIGQSGLMNGLYLTTNEQTWNVLTTSSVMPLTYTTGNSCGTVTVDPFNPRRVFIGGTTVMIGQGYPNGGTYYQWTTASASEFELNYGDYMSMVFSNSSFIHSGIHQILPVYHEKDTAAWHTYYFATDGGVFESIRFYGNEMAGFRNINRGLNTLEVNGLAVSPDGTLIVGANSNACPLIETHLDHTFHQNGGRQEVSWYDNGSLVLNHQANVIWTGDGGAVAASAFQQIYPQSRRTIFTSTSNGNIGRSYADYLDYNNTTTWTTGMGFMTELINGGPEIGSLSLWETAQNTAFNNRVKVSIDTLGYIFRKRQGSNIYDTVWLALPGTTSAVRIVRADTSALNDTIEVGTGRGSSFKIQKDDKVNFFSRANADYPFEYTFTSADLRVPNANGSGTHERTAIDSITVRNPIQSRMLCVGSNATKNQSGGYSEATSMSVWFSWAPSDFTKVYDSTEYQSALNLPYLHEKLHYWSPIFNINRALDEGCENLYVRDAVFSRDGLRAYVSAYDVRDHRSKLFRINGFGNIDFTQGNNDIMEYLKYNSPDSPLTVDTFSFNGNQWFPRPISSIAVDPRDNMDRLILTFEDYGDGSFTNVAYIENASSASFKTGEDYVAKPVDGATLPAYCALVEKTTGTVYVGTADGVYSSTNNGQWQVYPNLTGVPVTKIIQQTWNLPIRRALGHTGINANNYVFAKTKWANAIYFGTYGRGIFLDMQYVTDTTNEVVDSVDYTPVLDIPTVHGTGVNSVNLYPNPVYNEANLSVNAAVAGNGVVRVYDINGRLVMNHNLGHVAEGEHVFTLDCSGMSKGMYLVNVIIGGHTSVAKMMVR